MKIKQILAVLLVLVFLSPILAFAQEKATVNAYDEGSRMATFKVGDAEKKAKVSSADAKDKADLLGGEHNIDRYDDSARLGSSKEAFQHLIAVSRQDGNTVSLT